MAGLLRKHMDCDVRKKNEKMNGIRKETENGYGNIHSTNKESSIDAMKYKTLKSMV
jgi:hypothetical protein